MTTYSKETALYNNDAIASDISDAGNAYKAVVTEVGTTGVKIHPSGQDGSQAHPITDYTLIDDDGLEVFDGGASVAAFGQDGARIGRSANSHAEIDYHSLQLIDRDSDAYFYVSDLRNEDGEYESTETYIGPGTVETHNERTESRFDLINDATNNTYQVSVIQRSNNSDVTGNYTITKAVDCFYVYPALTTTYKVVATYVTDSDDNKTLTFGTRSENNSIDHNVGGYSSSFGKNNIAQGNYSHAQGLECKAFGKGSFAAGSYAVAKGQNSFAFGSSASAKGHHSTAIGNYTSAASNYQVAIGQSNVEDTQGAYALIVGNGAGPSRSNALTVSWEGTIANSGYLNPGHPLEVAYGGTGIDSFGTMNYVNGNSVNVANSPTSYAKLASFTLTPGKWLVLVGCNAAYAASGSRIFTISSASSVTAAAGRGVTAQVNSAASTCYTNITWLYNVSANTTYNVFGWQNSGSTLAMSAYIIYFRIA